MLAQVNYDHRQHAVYQQGRSLRPDRIAVWMNEFAIHAPVARPLTVLDLGSGTGRFAPALADTFGGPVYGVEPSDKMRAVATSESGRSDVAYLAGSAESIPLPDKSCDVVLMFLSLHHVRQREVAAKEIARVLRPGGRVLIRSVFSDRMPDLRWHHFFPRARDIEMQMFPASDTVMELFAGVALNPITLTAVDEEFAPDLATYASRIRLRAISTFEHLSEQECVEGTSRMDAAVAAERDQQPITAASDLLVLG
jgi:ubiquinone/menaquinone biosynthesis C-methylase UbiE